MKKALSIAVVCSALFGGLSAALAGTTNIYVEDWGSTNGGSAVLGNGNIALTGWTGIAVSQTAGPFLGIFAATGANDVNTGAPLPPNTVYFTTLTPNQTKPGMFYTTDTSGTGGGGDSSFADIDPTKYTNLTLSIEVRNGVGPTNYFAIREGGNWYVSTTALTGFGGAFPGFANTGIPYTNAASAWNQLTMNATDVTIGAQAPANLSGPITGIGIVELPTGGGFNYNELVISADGAQVVVANKATITAPPLNQTAYAGGGISFALQAAGTPPLTYTWFTNGVALTDGGRISGSTTNMLNLGNVTAADASVVYSVVVANSAGSATNSGFTLTVNAEPADFLYAETFPYVGPGTGNLPVSGVGWVGAFPAGTASIFSSGPGLGNVFSFSATAATLAYYTTTTNDMGLSGLPFVSINPESVPNVTFQANFTPGNGVPLTNPNSVVAHWAVQMSDGNWYSTVQRIPVQLQSQNNFTQAQFPFSRVATNWDLLTITDTSATIGSQATSPLVGNITGAGVVFVHDGSGGDFNFNNFVLSKNAVTVLPPTIGNDTPLNQSVGSGGGVSFGVAVESGAPPFTYGWTINGVPQNDGGRISGSHSPTLTISDVTIADNNAQIVAFVTNSAGSDESDSQFDAATLTVTNPVVGLIYSESFPFVGPVAANYAISGVGWVEAVSGAPNALFQAGGAFSSQGAVFAFLGSPATTAYYTTTATDTNQAGLPFPNINLSTYPSLNLAVDIAPSSSSSNVTAFFAVLLNGTNWFVSANPIPVPTTVDSGTFTTYNLAFNAAAANWKNLTVSSSGALIGSPATSNLTGVMTGAGLVFVTVGTGGTFNFDNFVITGTGVGGLNVSQSVGNTTTLTWVGNPAVNLQSSLSLTSPNWQDVPNTLGLYSMPVTTSGPGNKFYRLVKH